MLLREGEWYEGTPAPERYRFAAAHSIWASPIIPRSPVRRSVLFGSTIYADPVSPGIKVLAADSPSQTASAGGFADVNNLTGANEVPGVEPLLRRDVGAVERLCRLPR